MLQKYRFLTIFVLNLFEMKRVAVFPGSFDPITKGHESIIKRALPLFDDLYIAIGINADKKDFFPLKDRKKWIERVFENYKNISSF